MSSLFNSCFEAAQQLQLYIKTETTWAKPMGFVNLKSGVKRYTFTLFPHSVVLESKICQNSSSFYVLVLHNLEPSEIDDLQGSLSRSGSPMSSTLFFSAR